MVLLQFTRKFHFTTINALKYRDLKTYIKNEIINSVNNYLHHSYNFFSMNNLFQKINKI